MNTARGRGAFVELSVQEEPDKQLPITTTTTTTPPSTPETASAPNDEYIQNVCTAMKAVSLAIE